MWQLTGLSTVSHRDKYVFMRSVHSQKRVKTVFLTETLGKGRGSVTSVAVSLVEIFPQSTVALGTTDHGPLSKYAFFVRTIVDLTYMCVSVNLLFHFRSAKENYKEWCRKTRTPGLGTTRSIRNSLELFGPEKQVHETVCDANNGAARHRKPRRWPLVYILFCLFFPSR